MSEVARIGPVPRLPVIELEGIYGEPAISTPECEIAFRFDFPNPLTLLGAWHAYLWEHVRKKGQEFQRVGYVAKGWLRIMGIDATPGLWKIADVARYEDQRRTERVMGTTIRREQLLQQACLNHNRKRERLDRIPHFEKAEGEGRPRRPLADEEFRRLMRSFMPYRIRMFFLLAFHTGHRSRAIETLPWSRVNLEERYINFNDPAMRKTNKRRRDGFPIGDELYARLVAAYNKPGRDDLVIGRSDRGLTSSTYHACKKALKAVGINEEGLCRHTLRKTYCTERIKAGKEPEKVALSINENPATMRRNYVQLSANDLRATVNL